jgi:hypothetical protein
MPHPVARLKQCEAIIERGLATFVEVGRALLCIRDEALYYEDYASFDDYCRERWDFRRETADRYVRAAEVIALVNPMGLPEPRSERVARELAPLRDDPVHLRETWDEVIERHGPSPTAEQVREVVKKAKPGLGNYSKLNDDHAVDPWDGDVVFSFQFRQRIRAEIREFNRLVVDRLRNSTRRGDAGSPARLAAEVGDLTRAIQAARTTHGPAHAVAVGRVRDQAREVAVSAFLYGVTITQPPEFKRGEKSNTDPYSEPI